MPTRIEKSRTASLCLLFALSVTAVQANQADPIQSSAAAQSALTSQAEQSAHEAETPAEVLQPAIEVPEELAVRPQKRQSLRVGKRGQGSVSARSIRGFRQRGLASWYGKQFHGRKTACGERFDMHALTAANRTLPIPSYAEIVNPRTGQSVVVRINHRGSFHGKRVIDLSYAAARQLDLIDHGSAMVEIRGLNEVAQDSSRLLTGGDRFESIQPASADPVTNAAPAETASLTDTPTSLEAAGSNSSEPNAPQLFLNLGSFEHPGTAVAMRDAVVREFSHLAGRLNVLIQNGLVNLHVGPFGSIDKARAAAESLEEALGLPSQLVAR